MKTKFKKQYKKLLSIDATKRLNLSEALVKLNPRDEEDFCIKWAEYLNSICTNSNSWNLVKLEVEKDKDVWQDWSDDDSTTKVIWADCSAFYAEGTGRNSRIMMDFTEVDYDETEGSTCNWVNEEERGFAAGHYTYPIDKFFANPQYISLDDGFLDLSLCDALWNALEECVTEKNAIYRRLHNRTTTAGKINALLADFTEKQIEEAKDWFLKNIVTMEFLIPSGSPTCIPNYRYFFADKYNPETEDFDELIDTIETSFEKWQKIFFKKYRLNMQPDLNKKGRENIGYNIYIKWRRPETDLKNNMSKARCYENRLKNWRIISSSDIVVAILPLRLH